MTLNQSLPVQITFRNTGTRTWTDPNFDVSLWPWPTTSPGMSPTQINALPAGNVPPGGTATFTFTLTAPGSAGTYSANYRMLEQGVTWFGQTCGQNVTVSAVAPPPPPNPNPFGWHDATSCAYVGGWTCDPSDYAATIQVHLYEGATLLGTALANQPGEAAIGAQCGGVTDHRYVWPVPASLKDGLSHSISVYAINTPAGPNPLLWGTPQTLNCPATPPPPPPGVSCNFGITPTKMVFPPYGQSAHLAWTCTNAKPGTCTIDQGIGSVPDNNPNYPVTPANTTTYKLTCEGIDNVSQDYYATVQVYIFSGGKLCEIRPGGQMKCQ